MTFEMTAEEANEVVTALEVRALSDLYKADRCSPSHVEHFKQRARRQRQIADRITAAMTAEAVR